MTDTSREEALESGALIDYSDIAAPLGFRWPFAISEQAEAALYTSLPDGLSLEGLEGALIGAATAVMLRCLELIEAAGGDPELTKRDRLSIVLPMTWKDGETFSAVLVIGPDGDGQPAFALYLEGELA